jgi:hypothetical protein
MYDLTIFSRHTIAAPFISAGKAIFMCDTCNVNKRERGAAAVEIIIYTHIRAENEQKKHKAKKELCCCALAKKKETEGMRNEH